MPFTITVHRREDDAFLNTPPGDDDDLDAWQDECRARALFSAPLGAGGTIHAAWSSPAAQLGLPMLASLYEHGLRASADQLSVLAREVTRLEEAWATDPWLEPNDDIDGPAHPDTESATRGFRIDRTHLTERSASLKTAIRIASDADAILTIG